MIDATKTALSRPAVGRRFSSAALCVAAALLAGTIGSGAAMAGPQEKTVPADDHYQVYIGRRGAASHTLNREWGGLRLTESSAAGNVYSPALSDPASGAGVTYFTPSLSGVRVGVGMAATPSGQPQNTGAGKDTQYTDLGPRAGKGRDATGNWQVGGSLGYSGLELGANIGDHSDPSCAVGNSCKTNDFWDVGVALRVGSGAISAAYTASQPRSPRIDEVDRIDIFSLNAGYKVSSEMNIYGGVDWIDLQSTGEAAEAPLDTRFMLGTNLRF